MKLTDLLDQIDRLDQEATKGPWFSESKNEDDYYALTAVYNVFHNGDTPDRDLMAYGAYYNAEFIALARTALPQLAKALRAVIESCEETIRSVDKNLLPDERDHAFRDHADMVLDAITDALGADDGTR